MKLHGLLLQRHSGCDEERRHDGRIAVDIRNSRWCSNGLEIPYDNGEKVGDRAVDAVMGLHAAGVQFTVASRRPGKGMRHIVNLLKVTMPYASYNGGSLVMPGTWEVLSSHKLPREVGQTSLETLAANGVDAWVFIDDNWYLTHPDGTYVPLETHTVGYEGVLVERFDDLDLDAVDKIVGSHAGTALVERLEGELAKRASVPLERIAVLGDMGNDMAMFEVAGVSIAMGQAAEKVRRGATLVSSSNADDGFALALEALVRLRGRR